MTGIRQRANSGGGAGGRRQSGGRRRSGAARGSDPGRQRRADRGLTAAATRAGSTVTNRPRWPVRNCTVPARLAKIVSSLPRPDALAGLEAGAALAHDDLAAGDLLAGEDLHAEALGVGVAAVARRAESLLMSHRSPPSWRRASWRPASSRRASSRRASSRRASWPPAWAWPRLFGFGLGLGLRRRGLARQHLDVADLEPGELGAVALAALVAALGLELQHVDLLARAGGRRSVASTFTLPRSSPEKTASSLSPRNMQRLERDLRALVFGHAIDEKGVALLHAVLLAADFDDCVHDRETAPPGGAVRRS